MFNFSLNMLYPVEPIVNGIVDALKIKRDSVDVDGLLASLREKTECTMLNPKFDIDSYNLKLKKSPIMIKDLQLGSLYINFPKTYMKNPSIFKLSDIQFDLQFYKNDHVPDEQEIAKAASSSSSALMKAVNCFIRNIKLEFSNIHVRLFIGDTVEYCFMIKQIKYDVNEKEVIDEKDKLKFAFIHKKQILIKRILFKECNEENDKAFFNDDEATLAEQMAVYINKNTMFITHNEIVIDFNHDLTEKELIINNNTSPLFFECISTKAQIGKIIQTLELLKYFFMKKTSNALIEASTPTSTPTPTPTATPTPTSALTPTPAPTPTPETKKAMDFMGIPMNKLSLSLTMSSSYCAIIDNQQEPKPKIWMIYDNYFKSYYDLKETVSAKTEFIQKHLLYHDENFLYVYLDSLTISNSYNTIEKQIEGNGSIKSIEVKFIQPNQVKNKKDILIIKNTEANDIDKLFNENYFKYFFAVIKFGAYYYQIVNLDKIDLGIKDKTITLSVNQITCDCNIMVLSHLTYLFQVNQLIKINYDEGKNLIKDISHKQPLTIEINVHLINYRIQTNKKSLRLYQKFYEIYYKKKPLNEENDNSTSTPKDKLYYNEVLQQQIGITISDIRLKHSSKNTSIAYSKLLCCYVNNNLIYPLLLQNNLSAEDDYFININESSNESLKLNIMTIKVSFDQILFFMNPLLGKKVLSYVQLFMYSLNLFSCFIKMEPVVSLKQNYLKEIQLDCKVKEIQLISFSSINIPKQKKELNKLIEDNEKIFKLLFNPLIKFKISDIHFKVTTNDKSQHVELSMGDMKLMIKKVDNRFTKDNAAYQMFVENQKEDENFEYITYNPSITNKECFNASIDIITKRKIENDEEGIAIGDNKEDFVSFITQRKKTTAVVLTTIQGSVQFYNIAIVPLPLRLNDILNEFDIAKIESSPLNSTIAKTFNNSCELIEIISYKKFLPNDKATQNDSKLKATKNYDVTVNFDNILIDLFAEDIRNNEDNEIDNEDINHNKNKMRLITQITSLSINLSNINKNDITSLTVKISNLNTIFMKNLDLLKESSNLLIGRNNSIAAKESFWRQIGFAEILSCQDIRFDSNKVTNTVYVMSIHFFFCYDSMRFLSKFISNIGKNIKTIKALFENIIEDDEESVMTDIYQFKDIGNDIEYRSIGQYSHERFTNKYELSQENKRVKRETKNSNYNDGNTHSKKSDIPLKIALFISSIKISLFEGEDFNFQGRYISDISGGLSYVTPHAELVESINGKLPMVDEHLKDSDKLINSDNKETPNENIENVNKRNESNSIVLSIDKLECKCSYYE